MSAVEIEIAPGSDVFDAEDALWLQQVAGLVDELRQEEIPLRSESRPVPGEKGDIETIIAALGSAGVVSGPDHRDPVLAQPRADTSSRDPLARG